MILQQGTIRNKTHEELDKLVTYRQATLEDIPTISRLHYSVGTSGEWKNEFLSEICGFEFLNDVFKIILKLTPEYVLAARNQHGKIIGFIIGVYDIRKLRFYLPHLFVKAILGRYAGLNRRLLLKKGWSHLHYLLSNSNPRLTYTETFDLVVDPKYRRHGIARKLIHKLHDRYQANGVQKVQVIIGEGSEASMKLFKYFGYKYVNSISTSTGRMRLLILDLGQVK